MMSTIAVRLLVSTVGAVAGEVVHLDEDTAADLAARGAVAYMPDEELELELDLGTVAGVLALVGDDKEQAQAALDAERAKGENARVTLVAKLEAIVAD